MMSSRSYWAANLDALSAVCRPVVVELLGHGRSPAPDDPSPYEPDSYVGHFEKIREEIGAERWLVCGHSLGGALTLRYALSRPDRVMAQVFTNSQSALGPSAWRERVRAGVETAARALDQGGTGALEMHPFHPRRARHFPKEVQDALIAEYEDTPGAASPERGGSPCPNPRCASA